jgi:hypothetical protein
VCELDRELIAMGAEPPPIRGSYSPLRWEVDESPYVWYTDRKNEDTWLNDLTLMERRQIAIRLAAMALTPGIAEQEVVELKLPNGDLLRVNTSGLVRSNPEIVAR